MLNRKMLCRGGILASLAALGLVAGCNASNTPGQNQDELPSGSPAPTATPPPNNEPNNGAAPNEATPNAAQPNGAAPSNGAAPAPNEGSPQPAPPAGSNAPPPDSPNRSQ